MKADLHMHSTASDGVYSPGDLVRRAHEAGVTLMALTDHDSAEGVAQAAQMARELGVALLPGVEMGCSAGNIREIHVLGFGIDPDSEIFREFCRIRREKRELRAKAMVQRLIEAGKNISMDRVRELAGGVIARPHVARVLVEAGHASSVKDAFDKYLTPGRCGYVPREKLSVAEAVDMIARVGGISVLAHPMEMRLSDMNIEALVGEWKTQGLCGIEVYHPSASNRDTQFLLSLARREGLLVTGGSDFHGESVRASGIGQEAVRWKTMDVDVQALLDAIAAQKERAKQCRV